LTFRAGANVDGTLEALTGRLGFASSHVYRHVLLGFSAKLSTAQVAAIRADARVRTIQPDRSVKAFDERLPTWVDRDQSDKSSTQSGDGKGSVNIDVAVIDTGIDTQHSDLNVIGGVNCSDGGPKHYPDANGHGTHVAGTIAAKDNAIGVVGAAPGARLWAVRVLDKNGSGTWSSVICGIDWVTAHAPANGGPIKVANMSLGGWGTEGSCDGGMRQAICVATEAGVTFVVAAGNSATDLADFVPATFPEVLTVTAVADFNGQPGGGAPATCRVDVDDTNANFSNYAVGAEDVPHTIAAPGVCILSTWLGGGYNTISGTSMASPHVAGTAALALRPGTALAARRGSRPSF
jgi:subtilisin